MSDPSEERPAHNMIKLKSAEGHEFFIDRRCAMVSGTIKTMLSGQFAESRVRYTNSAQRIADFPIEPELALELLIAAGYLDC